MGGGGWVTAGGFASVAAGVCARACAPRGNKALPVSDPRPRSHARSLGGAEGVGRCGTNRRGIVIPTRSSKGRSFSAGSRGPFRPGAGATPAVPGLPRPPAPRRVPVRLLLSLDLRNRGDHLLRHALFGKVVPGGIEIVVLREGLVLHDAVVEVEGVPLAALDEALPVRAGVGHDHVEVLGKSPVGIRVKGDVRPGDPLVLGPGVHDGHVVDAIDHHFLDTDGL
mmetsp:Transcript_110498/g.226004  ORF Transcript_110498/g.226004 Transcript_110498/m.226004 type:complete len:224 (+) Transcript_110498:534-1205(+)